MRPGARKGETTIATRTYETDRPVERAVLVGVEIGKPLWSTSDSLDELEQLAATAGVEVVGRVTQKLSDPNPATLVGKGKIEEIKAAREETSADLLLFDEELTPSQQRNLEDALATKILDRTGIILDIFARHAQTREGRLQVELAQLEYRLPRLTRMWTHLSRQAVGGVGLRGPGETQLEVDRRRAQERISKLKNELVEVHEHRERYRQKRRREGVPIVALVGYTNAGKSTLLNSLSDADVRAENVLFATLDPTTRFVALPDGQQALLTDTVGFIQRLPTQLVAAFRATLEEIQEADVLVHVLDLTHPNAEEQSKTVDQVLNDLGAGAKPRVVALNKIDRLFPQFTAKDGASDVQVNGAAKVDASGISEQIRADMGLTADYVPISARFGWGMDELLKAVQEKLKSEYRPLHVLIPYGDSELVSLLHERGVIESEEHVAAGTLISGRVPGRFSHLFERYKA